MARGNLLLLCRPKAPHQPPILLKYRSAKWFILTTICTAVFTVCDLIRSSIRGSLTKFIHPMLGYLSVWNCTCSLYGEYPTYHGAITKITHVRSFQSFLSPCPSERPWRMRTVSLHSTTSSVSFSRQNTMKSTWLM